jgi:hypothetical protein
MENNIRTAELSALLILRFKEHIEALAQDLTQNTKYLVHFVDHACHRTVFFSHHLLSMDENMIHDRYLRHEIYIYLKE